MTKKHYEAIASILERMHPDEDSLSYQYELSRFTELAERLADYFATDNPRFDRVRFLTACGIEQVCDECGEVHDHENEVMSRA